jgi:lipoprotein-releasing system permease protein
MWFLAIRQMMSKKKQTALIFLGVTFSTMIYIIIAGIQYGMREYLSEQLLNNTAHVIISGDERKINGADLRERFFPEAPMVAWVTPPAGKREEARLENPKGWFDRLEGDLDVRAYAPRLTLNAILNKGVLRSNVVLTGIIPDKYMRVTSIADYVIQGSLENLKSGTNTVIVGSGVMERLGARLDQTVFVSTGRGESRPFKIVGVFELGNEQIDKTVAFAHLGDVQTLNHTPGRVSEITVALNDIDLSNTKAEVWRIYTNDKVQSWEEANASFLQVIRIQDIVRMVIVVALLLVSAFGMYNVLSIMIAQKQKEIAILRSIGYGPNRILSLILIQGLTLGLSGAAAGIILGHVINLIVDNIDLGLRIGRGTSLIVSYAPHIYLVAGGAAVFSSFVAAMLPARQAARLTPLDIIRANL